MRNFITFILIAVTFGAGAQTLDYFIVFKDKANTSYKTSEPQAFLSPRAIQRRKTQNITINTQDFPPNQNYVTEISKFSKVRYTSRWLNGVLIKANVFQLNEIKKLSFVKEVLLNGDLRNVRFSLNSENEEISEKFESLTINDFGNSTTQNTMLGVDKMHADGFKGEGILIGILDSGFSNANNLSVFQKLFTERRVQTTWDFVNDEINVYNDHSHGTTVLSVMASNLENSFIGIAPYATYALFKTEDVDSETKLEEINWLLAAERADSLGVDVINSSLGYTTFDNPATSYKTSDLNGNTSIITKAADWAVGKGIIVVTSAGNDGRTAWKKISMPADADSVISVGAVNGSKQYASFSSIGPSADGRVKPELSAMGSGTTVANPSNSISASNGTSFSSPLVAALAAGLKQAYPTFSAMKIRNILIKSASQVDNPDEFLGYGIPNYERAREVAEFEKMIENSSEALFVYPNPVSVELSLKGIVLDESITFPSKLTLYTSSGRKIYSTTISNSKFTLREPIINHPAGIYYLQIEDGSKTIVRRISKI